MNSLCRGVRGARTVLVSAVLVSTVLLGGCQSLDLSNEELTWQALHAVDIAQTLSAADDPCYKEDAWLTQKLIGEQPSDAEVVAWGVGSAVGHMLVTNLLDNVDAPGWVRKLWSYGTVSLAGYTIAHNYREGVRVLDDNQSVTGCYR